MQRTVVELAVPEPTGDGAVMKVLVALSISHFLNDTIQAVLPAIYPILKDTFRLSFAQVGMITLTYQSTASVLQPLVGAYADRRPLPYSLAVGMGFTLIGLVMLSQAGSFHAILVASVLVGTGSSIFHPEASRLARLASGGRHGFAQSVFQVGGNLGTSIGPLLAAAIVVPRGLAHILWFSVLALGGIVLLGRVGGWYSRHMALQRGRKPAARASHVSLSRSQVIRALAVLLALTFSKHFYLTSLTSFYTFYLLNKFGVTVQQSQIYLFVFLFSVAAGTIIGGPLGDRFGRKYIIWLSILGAAPFALILPYVGPLWTAILTVVIGVILASAFPAIIVYAQELVPGKVGMIAGLFFGFAFGVAGVGSALLGRLADQTSIQYVFHVCSFFPLIGLLTIFLPRIERAREKR
jgi:FSR family fosmidomycin resistance protein-like MFS transporter